MIEGRVLPTGEAVVNIIVRGPNGQSARIEAMIDTGFTDELTLPPWVIERLNLTLEEEADYTLADGMRSRTRVFRGEIHWLGTWREVTVTEIDHDALLGIEALRGCNLNMDIVDGGMIQIRPL